MNHSFDTRAWLVWVLSAATATMIARNPLYSLLLLACSRLVNHTFARSDGAFNLQMSRGAALRLAALVLLFSGLFTALFVHAGETTLFVLPPQIPLAGGIITLEAFLNGAANGLLLLTLLSFFLTFNRVVTAERLARLAPAAFRDLGIVVLIALTYIPETTRHIQRIREAQAVRGQRIRGLLDWRPLVLPLLVGGLERAMALAEAMVARGFGATSRAPMSGRVLLMLGVAMALSFGGWVLALWWRWPGLALLGAGVLLMVAVLATTGRAVTVTRYRPRPWQATDTALLLASVAPLALMMWPGGPVDSASLAMNFLNGLRWPPFDMLLGVALLLYAFPTLVSAMLGGGPLLVSQHD